MPIKNLFQNVTLPLVILLLCLLSAPNALQSADDAAGSEAEIRKLKEQVRRLETELRSLREEVAKLKASVREGKNDKPQTSTKKPRLEIRVIDGDWGGAPASNIRALCRSAAQSIWQHLKDRAIEPITIRYSTQGPMVIFGTGADGERRVLLNVKGTYWSQFAFQFAHEFCHILCNYRGAKNPNLWFEESLCEAASLFALRSMAESWKTNPPYSNWKSYSTSLASYAADRVKSGTLDNGKKLVEWFREHEAALGKNATDRGKNQVVAVALLPLLEAGPQHWNALAYLNQWDAAAESLSFPAYLADWYRRVPDQHKSFVADVAALFEISVKE